MKPVKTRKEFELLAQQYAIETHRPAVAEYIGMMTSYEDVCKNLYHPESDGYLNDIRGDLSIISRTVAEEYYVFMKRFGAEMKQALGNEYEFYPEAQIQNEESFDQHNVSLDHYAERTAGSYSFLAALFHSVTPPSDFKEQHKITEQFSTIHSLNAVRDDWSYSDYIYEAEYNGKVFDIYYDPDKYENTKDLRQIMGRYVNATIRDEYDSNEEKLFAEKITAISAFREEGVKEPKLHIMPELFNTGVDLMNYNTELKDPKYNQWAKSAFDNMFSTMYNKTDLAKMEKAHLSPMHFVSIDGKPLHEYIKTSPVYDPNQSFEEQAERCAIAAILDGGKSIEVRSYDAENNKVSKAAQVKVSTDIKEPFSFKKLFSRLFGFITGEPSKKERFASIGTGEMHQDTPEEKEVYRNIPSDARTKSENVAEHENVAEQSNTREPCNLAQLEDKAPQLTSVPDRSQQKEKSMDNTL